MKLKKLKWVTIASGILFFALISTVSAKYYDWGYSYDVIGYNPYTSGSSEYVANQAEDYWNDSRANTHIGAAPGSDNPVYWNDYSYSWYGQYRKTDNTFSIRLNSRTLAQDAGDWGLTEYGLGINTMVHELGHALYLAHPNDHEATGDLSIMGYDRERDNHHPRYRDVNNLIDYRGY